MHTKRRRNFAFRVNTSDEGAEFIEKFFAAIVGREEFLPKKKS